ncbi:MAG: ABC transporter permease [Candidatus Thermoplasmatota archaeon]|nr:ABC transporter permease [Candidatus Thermoplasmatota archaeon]MCL5963830.1 ABC transporter permease [Candidatus Thermoplasmatota archaeon]
MKFKNVKSYLVLHIKSYMRSRSAIFFQILFPVILMLLFGSIFSGGGTSHTTIAIQNMSPSPASWSFINGLNKSGVFTVNIISSSINIKNYASEHSINSALIIPQNFTYNMINHKIAYVIYYDVPGDSTSAINQQILQNVISNINLHYSNTTPVMGMTTDPILNSAPKTIDYYLPGLMGFTLLNSMFTLLYQVPNYKKDKIFRQFSFTGLTKSEWLLGTIIWSFLITLLADAVLIYVAYAAFGVTLNVSAVSFALSLAIIIASIIFFSALGILAGMVSENEETVTVLGNLILFPMMFLSGVFFPVTMMPSYLRQVSEFLPLTYSVNGLYSILIFNNFGMALYDLGIIIIIAVITFVVAISIFSWKSE